MRASWDPRKARANLAKHGVRFSDAEAVLFDPVAITREDRMARGEQRFVTIGRDGVGRLLVVVYSYREDEVRLISARTATRNERRKYEEGIRLQ
ncbi:MAG: BrnT family toxin [Candidatus Eisenbacteria bacterium]|nr:BrnT family toxin [Candidatus Eisenbacteria bacterium]